MRAQSGIICVLSRAGIGVFLWAGLCFADNPVQNGNAALQAAERLAWLRNWSAALPYYRQAEREFTASGDRRNALFVHISGIRGELQRLPLLETSELLANALEDPLVQSDPRLQLRCLVVKGDVDLDMDTEMARRDWTEAHSLAQKLGEAGWVNRAQGELAIISFLSGNHEAAALSILAAIQKARQIGDIGSVVRYETMVGDGLVLWKQYDRALKYFDDALDIAKSQPDLQYPLLVYSGKIEALIGLGRTDEAERLLDAALAVAKAKDAIGYEGELRLRYGLLELKRGLQSRAIEELQKANRLADSVNSPRIAAQSTFMLAECLESKGDLEGARTAISTSIHRSREAGDRVTLPATLAEAARINLAMDRLAAADQYFDEATEIADGIIASVANLTGKDEFINSLNHLYLDHFRFHVQQRNPAAAFAVAERVHGRAIADALRLDPKADNASAKLTQGEKRVAHLQLALMRSNNRVERRHLLQSLVRAEEEAYPAFISQARLSEARQNESATLRDVQRTLGANDALLEYLIASPQSFCIVVTRDSTAIFNLPGEGDIEKAVDVHLKAIARKLDLRESGSALFRTIIPAGATAKANLIVVPDGVLHRLPFDTVVDSAGNMLLAKHTVWYVPSGTVLNLLSNRPAMPAAGLPLLAVSTGTDGIPAPVGEIPRSMFDLTGVKLPALPGANSEARLVGEIMGPKSVIITGLAATESAVKGQPLSQYRVLHFAVHGLANPERPERAGLVLFPDTKGPEDGLWQVREIERARLHADLVTLSACRAGDGKVMGAAGIESLVTPFLAAGAEAVVANLWDSDDTFTASLMRGFYTYIAHRMTLAEALRHAKLDLIARYGADAPAYLWAGFILTGVNRKVLT
jgi:CHAT domain-containing protein/tetratricopeptide (TPR) repeat protein